jgi:hypothetical protein
MQYPENKYLNYKDQYNKLKNNFCQWGRGVTDDQLDTVHFWGNQFCEHALMLGLMLIDKNLKNEAMELHLQWSEYMKKTFEDQGIDKYKITLNESDLRKLNESVQDIDQPIQLMNKLTKFKTKVKELVDAGNWIGWVYPAFVSHILDEINYVMAEINGSISDEDKINFWNQSNAEEAGLSGHLLDPDPVNDPDIEHANEFYHEVMEKIKNGETSGPIQQMIALSRQFVTELDGMVTETRKKIHAGKVKSIIHPALIDHIDREDKRCIACLEKIRMKH